MEDGFLGTIQTTLENEERHVDLGIQVTRLRCLMVKIEFEWFFDLFVLYCMKLFKPSST